MGLWLNRAGVMFSVVEEPLVKDEWSQVHFSWWTLGCFRSLF